MIDNFLYFLLLKNLLGGTLLINPYSYLTIIYLLKKIIYNVIKHLP